MNYELSILFFVRKDKIDNAGEAPIYLRITVNGKRAETSTNKKIEVLKWDNSDMVRNWNVSTRTLAD